MAPRESRGVYCLRCGWFSLRAAGERCASCRSVDDIIERRGIVCPSCHRPTPNDDPNWQKCLECEAPLPEAV